MLPPRTYETFNWIYPTDYEALDSAYAAVFGLSAASGAEVLRLKHQDDFLNLLKGSASLAEAKRYFDISGIRYIVVPYAIVDRDFTLVGQTLIEEKSVYLYEYRHAQERFALFGKATVATCDGNTPARLADRSLDLRTEIFVCSETGPPALAPVSPSDHVRLLRDGANEVHLETETKGPRAAVHGRCRLSGMEGLYRRQSCRYVSSQPCLSCHSGACRSSHGDSRVSACLLLYWPFADNAGVGPLCCPRSVGSQKTAFTERRRTPLGLVLDGRENRV